MAKKFAKLAALLLTLALTLTYTCAFAEESLTEWLTLEEVQELYTEAIGNDTFKVTIRSSYWWEDTTDGWYQFEASYGNTSIGMNIPGEYILPSDEVIALFEAHGAFLMDTGRFIINPEIFPWEAPDGFVLDSSWGEILIEKNMALEFIGHCTESTNVEHTFVNTEDVEHVNGVTFYWFEKELYDLGLTSFNLKVESEISYDTCDYVLWFTAQTEIGSFSMAVNTGDMWIKDDYIFFAPEWANKFMSVIHDSMIE